MKKAMEDHARPETRTQGRWSVWVLLLLAFLALSLSLAAHPTEVDLGALQVQVMLDRCGFSPGLIDGHVGDNARKALAKFQAQGNKEWLVVPLLANYRITAEDAEGPFLAIPSGLKKQASLKSLGYPSLLEALAERFHSSPQLLRQLNPRAPFVEGAEVRVPNVNWMAMPVDRSRGEMGPVNGVMAKPVVVVTVEKSSSSLTVADSVGKIVFYAPVTTGSLHDPLPLGEWKVLGVKFNPTFLYNPSLFWNSRSTDRKALLPAGPRNPTGLVWVELSKPHYGMHGTPNPALIGRTHSHGCVRLTNWDALRLASLVKPGTRVLFTE